MTAPLTVGGLRCRQLQEHFLKGNECAHVGKTLIVVFCIVGRTTVDTKSLADIRTGKHVQAHYS